MGGRRGRDEWEGREREGCWDVGVGECLELITNFTSFYIIFYHYCRIQMSMEVYDTQIQRTTRASCLEATHLAT